MSVCGLLVAVVVAPLVAAGLPSPLDKLRTARRSPGQLSLFERLFGFSLAAGRRYVLLLALLTLLAGELGLLLWGRDVLGDWGVELAVAFVPVIAAAWAVCRLCAVFDHVPYPRSDIARKLLACAVVIGLFVLSLMPAFALGLASEEPPVAAELLSTTMLFVGAMDAFPSGGPEWASDLMNELSSSLLIPFVCAGWYIVAGVVLLVLDRLIRWWIARRAPTLPPLPKP